MSKIGPLDTWISRGKVDYSFFFRGARVFLVVEGHGHRKESDAELSTINTDCKTRNTESVPSQLTKPLQNERWSPRW